MANKQRQTLNVFIESLNDVTPDLSDTFNISTNVSDALSADAIILGHDVSPMNREICETAKLNGIPTFVLQHGRLACSDYAWGGKKPSAEFILVWGDTDVDMAIEGGWDKENVIKIGSPIFEHMVKPRPDRKTVIFAPAHIEALDEENDYITEQAKAIWGEINKVDCNPIAKLLQNEHNEDDFEGKKFITRRSEKGHIKKTYREVLKNASCVVSQFDGTFELMAYSMDIPVIKVDNHFKKRDGAYQMVEVEGVKDAVEYALHHPEHNRAIRKNYAITEGGLGFNAKANIVQAIRNRCEEKKEAIPTGEFAYYLRDDLDSSYYRTVLPYQAIEQSGKIVHRAIKGDDSPKIQKTFRADHFQISALGEERMLGVACQMKSLGRKVVMDFDKDIFNVSPFSSDYKRFGTKEVSINGKKLWIDGDTIDCKANKVHLENFEKGMRIVDQITVSSPTLIPIYSRYNENVVCLPTCIDADKYKVLPSDHEGVRIGWFGYSDNLEDIAILDTVLPQIQKNFPDVTFVVIGAHFEQIFNKVKHEYHEAVPKEYLHLQLASLGLDMALLPSADNQYNMHKTPIRWCEMSALGIPSVASYNAPYGSLGTNNAVYIQDNENWYEGIATLIEDSILRAKIGSNAKAFVKDNFDIKDKYKHWLETYKMEKMNEAV